jgi:predicted flap endonuclease-1-like 5' DNA nuclease
MKAICEDGTEIECANFTAIDSGVLLTKDRKRDKVIGFVPNEGLRYVVPEEASTEHRRDIEGRTSEGAHPDRGPSPSGSEYERERERERENVAMLRDRLDRLEARLDLSTGNNAERPVSAATMGGRSRDASGSDEIDPETPEPSAAPEAAAGGTRAEPAVESDSEPEPVSESAGDEFDGSEGNDGENSDERERGTSGFDPVAIVAGQDDPEASAHGTERTEDNEDTDLGTIDVMGSDPVATVAGQTEASANERAEETTSSGEGQESDETGSELQRIDGLGPTYAGRLEAEGVETLADLEATDATEVASIADVSETRAGEWIEQVGELTG